MSFAAREQVALEREGELYEFESILEEREGKLDVRARELGCNLIIMGKMEGNNPQDFSFFHCGWKISTTNLHIFHDILA